MNKKKRQNCKTQNRGFFFISCFGLESLDSSQHNTCGFFFSFLRITGRTDKASQNAAWKMEGEEEEGEERERR